MKRTQVQLDDVTYQLLRRKAFEGGTSLAALIREAVKHYLEMGPARRRRMEDFTFIGSGRSPKSKLDPISERHDEALAEDYAR